MIELFRNFGTLNVPAKIESGLWKIMDIRVLKATPYRLPICLGDANTQSLEGMRGRNKWNIDNSFKGAFRSTWLCMSAYVWHIPKGMSGFHIMLSISCY